jgi:CheY-like chemotaxis protein
MFQSVRELLINCATHATKRPIKVTMEALNHVLRIEVRDEGPGFDVATVLGDAASQNNEISSKFGLFNIKERMEALGGHFHVDSSPRSGTSAILELPLFEASQDEGRKKVSSIPDNFRKKLRVLLVDDHAMVRQGLKSLLQSYDEVELVGEAASGEEAVALVRQFIPEIVVMDIQMPGMDGIEATRIIKSQFPDTKVIGLSVNADESSRQAMTKAGAALLMSKEAAVEELYSIVADV